METALTLKKALEIAQGMETALQDVCEMQGNPQAEPVLSPEEVHAVSNKKNSFVCYRCGQMAIGQPIVHSALPSVINVRS